ncbi:hypothetical protein GF326_03440 [Candidatus Bathyarchaeota archaeon]|nr:hypothetical protein [Candidatus Bathyarchaeota archaeon]
MPILSLFFGQATGFLVLGPSFMMGLSAAILVIDYMVFRVAMRVFQRENILSQSR